VQIGWLGFPGTSALPHVDYVIADRFIFPESLRADFTEEPLFIDAGFQVSDSQRIFGPRPERAALGLPDDAFVFCAFNNSYKITPAMFECWLRILQATPRSILWLLEDNPWARSHLLEFAQRAGVDSHRLHFASRIDPKDYLARFQVADLFLDTTPYNAGTTANDALWAGLPLITLSGRTYVSRMAGSLLTTAGLPHLVCETFAEYEAKAIQLYERPWEAAEASAHLRRLKGEGLLFDTKRFCREFEQRLVDLLSAPAPV
jgi:predicted O-linked N-acetylglucosamine transferase (SPINDLY family)